MANAYTLSITSVDILTSNTMVVGATGTNAQLLAFADFKVLKITESSITTVLTTTDQAPVTGKVQVVNAAGIVTLTFFAGDILDTDMVVVQVISGSAPNTKYSNKLGVDPSQTINIDPVSHEFTLNFQAPSNPGVYKISLGSDNVAIEAADLESIQFRAGSIPTTNAIVVAKGGTPLSLNQLVATDDMLTVKVSLIDAIEGTDIYLVLDAVKQTI